MKAVDDHALRPDDARFHPRATRSRPPHGRLHMLAVGLACVASLIVAAPALAQVAPPLGVAGQFGALGNSGVTGSTGTGTVVSGDVGSSPTATVTNFPPSSVVPPYVLHLANDGVVQQARADSIAAYGALSQGAGTALANDLSTVGALTPGIYSIGAADLPSGTSLTLNDPSGTGIFIFNVASSLTANVNSSVLGSADPCNVYWQVGESATLNGTAFWGTVIADASITIGDGANLVGRALAGTGATGAVTMAGAGGNTIGGCSTSTPLVLGPAAPTVSKSFSPETISVDGTSVLTITLFNSSADTDDPITSLTDNLPTDLLVAPQPNASNTCGGVVSAPAGGSTVSMTGGSIPQANLATNTLGSCTITVSVTSSIIDTYVNTIEVGGLITAGGSNAEAATATVNVVPLGAGVAAIPTLSWWTMMLLASLLAFSSIVMLRRRSN